MVSLHLNLGHVEIKYIHEFHQYLIKNQIYTSRFIDV